MKNIEKVISGIVIVVLVVLGIVFIAKGNYKEQTKKGYNPIVTKSFINNQIVEKVKDGQVNKIKVYDLVTDSYIIIELDEDEFSTVHVGYIY